MANVVPVTASVLKSDSGQKLEGIAGETITAGQVLYKSSADQKLYKAEANDTLAKAAVVGVALNGASAGQPVDYVNKDKELALGSATLVVGTVYVLSATAGAICPVDDLVTTDRVTVIGVGVAANKIHLAIAATVAEIPA